MTLKIDSPLLTDIEELLRLYFMIYGDRYPIPYGTDPKIMADTIQSNQHRWLIMRDTHKKLIAGSVVFEIDTLNKLGKVAALVVHPEYRKQNIAQQLVETGTEELVGKKGPLNSLYTTTRTLSVGPQLVFLRNGYFPLGIFPNAHRLRQFESTTLMARFKPGVLNRRNHHPDIPKQLQPIYKVLHQTLGISSKVSAANPKKKTPPEPTSEKDMLEFETIFAPHYVLRKFEKTFSDPYDRFYPFHTPNLLLSSTKGETEIYAYLSKSDGYCTIVANTTPFYELAGRVRGLLDLLRSEGVSYIETLIGIEHVKSIQALLEVQFLPSAVYPAMKETTSSSARFPMQDFVVMSRTMEPLNFRGMSIDRRFKPYVDQYVKLWQQMHLNTLEVFNDYE